MRLANKIILVTCALHTYSHRRDKPMVTISCGGMPEQLLESELFGHKRGAFTGAYSDKIGLFELVSYNVCKLSKKHVGGSIHPPRGGDEKNSASKKMSRLNRFVLVKPKHNEK